MLDPNPPREEHTLLPIVTSPAVTGRVLVLGHSPMAVSLIANNPSVEEVIYAPGRAAGVALPTFRNRAAAAKVRTLPPTMNPSTLQRRDIGVETVSFLFCDLFSDPWALGREQHMKARAREFRPRATGYRFQELDVAAHWIAAGCTLEDISGRAFMTFAAATGILLPDETDDHARRCAALALEYAGRGR